MPDIKATIHGVDVTIHLNSTTEHTLWRYAAGLITQDEASDLLGSNTTVGDHPHTLGRLERLVKVTGLPS